MSPLRVLAPDQRAVLELLLRQGRSYAELSELLGISEDAVRTRAHDALATLAPNRPAPVGEDGAVADWILGQLDAGEADATSAAVARTPAWRAWAEDVTGQLAGVDGATVPAVPEAEPATPRGGEGVAKPRDRDAPRGTAKPRPRPVRDAAAARPRPVREAAPAREPADDAAAAAAPARPLRSSKLGGALLIGALALIVGLVLVLVVFRGDEEEEPAAEAGATATATATPQVVREIPLKGVGNRAQGLMRVYRNDDGNLVFVLAADRIPANRKNEVYAVWFTRAGGAPRNLGFSQAPVGKEGQFATGGPQQGQERDFTRWLVDYDNVVVARATADSASEKRPGQIVLRGKLPGGE